MKTRLFRPLLDKDDLAAVAQTFDEAWVGLGKYVSDFESAWQNFTGAPASLAVNSGTAALHLAVKAFKFQRGMEVLVPALTFSATAFSAIYEDLIPVFVDVDPETLCIDLNDLQTKITSKSVAVIAVHFGGNHCDLKQLVSICQTHKLKLIEDCAHSQAGTSKCGHVLGLVGDIGCYSFEEKKGITTGDGGMIVSKDVELIQQLKPLRWVGIDKDTWQRETDKNDKQHWYYEINEVGYKYNMNNMSAALGLSQLKKLNDFNSYKRYIIGCYLNGLEGKVPLFNYDIDGKLAYWLFGLRIDNRDKFVEYCTSKGVATGVHYTPLNKHTAFSKFRGETKFTNQIYPKMVTLPLHPAMTENEIEFIIETVNSF